MVAKLDDTAPIEVIFFFAVFWRAFEIQRADVKGSMDHIVEIVGIGTGESPVSRFRMEGILIVFCQDGKLLRVVVELGDVEEL